MYYYRRGETVLASLLPDLPLEPAERPAAGSPGIFLIDRDPAAGRASFCVSDPRQLTARAEDVSWLDPARMGVPAPVLPKRIQHTIDARLLGAGEHVIEVQASKDDYLPASRRYTFTVPAATIPDGGYGAISQASDGKTMFYTTLAQRCIGTDGVDIQAQVDALTVRVKTLEG